MAIFSSKSRVWFVTGLVAALVVGLGAAFVAAPRSGAAIPSAQMRYHQIAFASKGDLSDAGLRSAFASMDASMLTLAGRYAPGSVGLEPAIFEIPGPAAPTTLPSQALQALSADGARLVNASVPYSTEPNPAARPFRLRAAEETRARALQCLTETVYYEAALEPLSGKQAVAQVVLNRLRHPIYPKTVCGVVFQGSDLKTGCQFTFTCDGSLAHEPVAWAWKESEAVAERALNGFVAAAVGGATHYHADYVAPYWLSSLSKITKIGVHIFYRWPGSLGSPGAFAGQYAGVEPGPTVAELKRGPAAEPVRDAKLILASIGGPARTEIEAPVPAPVAVAAGGESVLGALRLDVPALKAQRADPIRNGSLCSMGAAADIGGMSSASRCGAF